eukprot:gene12053-16129_t
MGCTHSLLENEYDSSAQSIPRRGSKDKGRGIGSIDQRRGSGTKENLNNNRSMQDDARSFRSKLGAIKMLTKSKNSRAAFLQFLQSCDSSEFLICYQDIEEIKSLGDDQKNSRTAALVARYKSLYVESRVNGSINKPNYSIQVLWEGLGKLRNVDFASIDNITLNSLIIIAQNDILARLMNPFEQFLSSNIYKQWQEDQIKGERHGSLRERSCGLESGKTRLETCSDSYTDVLVVDDSIITLKLTGLTLERDGHHVERASNGEIALNLMKYYESTLTDCNKIVSVFPSDVSSISDDSKDVGSVRKNSLVNHNGTIQTVPTIGSIASGAESSAPTEPSLMNHGARIQLTAAHYHQLIIGMSSNIDDLTRARALECGMDFFLPKPFTLEKFIETIRASKDIIPPKASKNQAMTDEQYTINKNNSNIVLAKVNHPAK